MSNQTDDDESQELKMGFLKKKRVWGRWKERWYSLNNSGILQEFTSKDHVNFSQFGTIHTLIVKTKERFQLEREHDFLS